MNDVCIHVCALLCVCAHFICALNKRIKNIRDLSAKMKDIIPSVKAYSKVCTTLNIGE